MIDRDKVTELLSKYRSYVYAIRMIESPRMIAAGTASYSDMPRAGNGYGSKPPRINDGFSLDDAMDYMDYCKAVAAVDGALALLCEDEQSIIELKWMHNLTLQAIADRKHFSFMTVRRVHKRALTKLAYALRFVDVPEILVIERNRTLFEHLPVV